MAPGDGREGDSVAAVQGVKSNRDGGLAGRSGGDGGGDGGDERLVGRGGGDGTVVVGLAASTV